MTEDALKAAVREALNEIPHCEDILNDLTSALARRGVVVAAEEQRKLKNSLIGSIDFTLHAIINSNDASADIKNLAEDMHGEVHDLAAILSDDPSIRSATVAEIGLDNCSQATASESPAPKPARKVVHFAEDDAGITALCNDGSFWRWHRRADRWRLCDMTRIPEFDLPQTGDEQ
jgi:hypothetical protein